MNVNATGGHFVAFDFRLTAITKWQAYECEVRSEQHELHLMQETPDVVQDRAPGGIFFEVTFLCRK
jgi:hypothetical protein